MANSQCDKEAYQLWFRVTQSCRQWQPTGLWQRQHKIMGERRQVISSTALFPTPPPT